MLNPRTTRIVIAALRSGRYTQGRNALERDGKNCCLGVACREAIADGVQLSVHTLLNGAVEFNGASGVLPYTVRDWLGARDADPIINGGAAVHRNDSLGESFAQIADAFERQLEIEATAC